MLDKGGYLALFCLLHGGETGSDEVGISVVVEKRKRHIDRHVVVVELEARQACYLSTLTVCLPVAGAPYMNRSFVSRTSVPLSSADRTYLGRRPFSRILILQRQRARLV